MDLIADALLLAGALSAAVYCWVLSKRVKGLTDLDNGLGSAIASLSGQVNDMQSALKAAQSVTGSSVSEMQDLAERAEKAAENLRLMLATVQEHPAERERASEPPKATRVRKFPKPVATKMKAEPVVRPKVEITSEEDTEERPIKTVSSEESQPQDVVSQAVEPEARTSKSEPQKTPAQKLQQDIVDKISTRDDETTREELVQALQSILASSK